MAQYQADYYQFNHQDQDRLGLLFFARILKTFFHHGSILDYGCGTGFFLKKFDGPLYQKHFFDVSMYGMKCAQQNNPDAQIVNEPASDLLSGSLDCIASLHTLEHIADPSTVLRMFHEKLRVGGLLFFVVPNDSSIGKILKKDQWFAYKDKTHISLLAVEEWVSLTNAAGFSLVKVGTDGLWDIPYLKYVPNLLQKLLFFPSAAIQLLFARLFLPLRFGENLIIIAKKC